MAIQTFLTTARLVAMRHDSVEGAAALEAVSAQCVPLPVVAMGVPVYGDVVPEFVARIHQV